MAATGEPQSAAARIAAAGRLLAEQPAAALTVTIEVLREEPGNIDALLLSAAALRLLGQGERAWHAEKEALQASLRQPAMANAAQALNEGRLEDAERLLRPYLAGRPNDPAALRMLAGVARAYGRLEDAVPLLRQALELAPAYAPARHELADVYAKLSKRDEALAEAERLLAAEPGQATYLNLKANILNGMGRYQEAAAILEELVARLPAEQALWLSFGHVLRTLGRIDESIAAYRRVIALAPKAGIAWWSLASLQTVRFDDQDIAAMEQALAQPDASPDERLRLHFALGKALEDRAQWERSFGHYREGNRLRRAQLDYDAAEATALVRRSESIFSPDFFERRRGQGCAAPDPIFVIGLQRSGSTLVEQILSSHSMIEGTAELPDVPVLARRLGSTGLGQPLSSYPQTLADLNPEQLQALGREYLDRTRGQRDTDRPFFIDKLPNNWAHVGFIHLMLPQAKIIVEQRFTYHLAELGSYYRDYVELLRHFDETLPGRIHRVIYERLVEDPEEEIRRMLGYLDLPFEPSCLDFHRNPRPVRTASSEQVRLPINQAGIGRWTPYEPWLQPLKDALGPVLAAYPEAPAARSQPVTA
jgi:tetratricopeptide (TPR) repeat protein